MAKINKEEYEYLKNLDENWRWIARDKVDDSSLYQSEIWLYENKPKRATKIWFGGEGLIKRLDSHTLFQFIQWEDESPYNIQDLVDEYEKEYQIKNAKIVNIDADKITGSIHQFKYVDESEETEVKNKAELKSWFEDDKLYVGEYVKYKIDQLDEPEVLSWEWIDEHTYHEDEYDFYYADPDELKNLLVPKQEKQKVPKWFDEWCKGRVWGDKFHEGRHFTRSDVRALVQIADGESLHGLTQEQSDEISRDLFKYLDAFYYGYEVEEEQKYYVLGKHDTPILFRDYRNRITETSNLSDIYPKADSENFEFTEQEIKDYDPRYWAFRKPVEELEE